MGMIDHWHPVLPSNQLRNQQVGEIRLCGRDIALFRTSKGEVGALDNMCPHRRMKLSKGSVVDDKLQCRYHGWTFTCDGNGESPGTPKLTACAGNYETREEQGYIWLKPREAEAPFPAFNNDGFSFMCRLDHLANAPLEVAMDNFCEIEHTPTIHSVFGYRLEQMRNVEVRFEATERSVRVINVGPPKSLGWFLNLLLGIRKRFVFIDDWTTYFSPLYSVYEHYWTDPQTGKEALVRWRLYMFYTPVDDHHTRITTFSYAKSRYPGPGGCLRPFRGLMRRKLKYEIDLDVEILNHLASYETSLEGMKLSRFDKALGLNRERINRIYKGIHSDSKVGLRIAE
jgi:phenylpropionate dioxygenase-like ring-hydroxylating dioxygenase large terminal subunit